jgi:hypothetical protein
VPSLLCLALTRQLRIGGNIVWLMLSSDKVKRIATHLAARLRSADDQRLPAPFIFVEEALPADVYDCIPGALSKTAGSLKEQIHRGDPKVFFGSYGDRLDVRIPEGLAEIEAEASGFWANLYSAFTSRLVLDALLVKFEEGFTDPTHALPSRPPA